MQITSGEWVHICIGILEELFILQLDADSQRSLIEIINMDHMPVFSLHYGKAKTLSIFKKLINLFLNNRKMLGTSHLGKCYMIIYALWKVISYIPRKVRENFKESVNVCFIELNLFCFGSAPYL